MNCQNIIKGEFTQVFFLTSQQQIPDEPATKSIYFKEQTRSLSLETPSRNWKETFRPKMATRHKTI